MAALQNFIDNSAPTIKAAWLNAVDALLNTLFGGATTAAQARDALGVAAQPTFRNRVFNGRFQAAQFSNNITAASGYICDMWIAATGSTGTFTGARLLAVGHPDFPQFGRMLSGAANTVTAASHWGLEHRMEGVTIGDLNWGTSDAATMTLSFWARTSVPGTYSVSVRNPTAAMSYVTTYTSTDNAWHYYTVTIPGPTTGTWPITNNLGLTLLWVASSGTNFQTSSTDTWISGNFIASATQTQMMTTNGATLDITGVQFERGVVATAFEHISFQTELNRCQRYYETSAVTVVGYAPVAPMVASLHINERVMKRAAPSVGAIQVFATVGISNAGFGYVGSGPPHVSLTVGVAGATYSYQVVVSIDARL